MVYRADLHEGGVAAQGLGTYLTAELELVTLHVRSEALARAVQFTTQVTLVVTLACVHMDMLL